MSESNTCTFFTNLQSIFEALDEHGVTHEWKDFVTHECHLIANHNRSHKCVCGIRFLNQRKSYE